MKNRKYFIALGLMSGTSTDGIDVGLIKTDGKKQISLGPSDYYSFPNKFRKKLKKIFSTRISKKNLKEKKIIELENTFTKLNCLAIKNFLKKKNIDKNIIDIIGFHGQTISHNPRNGYSVQLGDAKKIADYFKINVVADFRNDDIKNGGEGAPLTPIFHHFLTCKIKKRICFINLGGIANLTFINHQTKDNIKSILAFDISPCCSLLDDWVSLKSNKKFDAFGEFAKKGEVDLKIIQSFLKKKYFLQKPPKSLDRSYFSISNIKNLTLNDGSATISAFIAQCLKNSLIFLPFKPDLFILSGGGRLNKHLVKQITEILKPSNVKLSDYFNWNGDFIEAYAFAFLSVRKLLGLPISFPKTTGVKKPMQGGKIFKFPPN